METRRAYCLWSERFIPSVSRYPITSDFWPLCCWSHSIGFPFNVVTYKVQKSLFLYQSFTFICCSVHIISWYIFYESLHSAQDNFLYTQRRYFLQENVTCGCDLQYELPAIFCQFGFASCLSVSNFRKDLLFFIIIKGYFYQKYITYYIIAIQVFLSFSDQTYKCIFLKLAKNTNAAFLYGSVLYKIGVHNSSRNVTH